MSALVRYVIATLVVVDMMRRLPADAAFLGGILGLLLSGAYGNAIDRLRWGWVTDFVKCYTEHPSLQPWLTWAQTRFNFDSGLRCTVADLMRAEIMPILTSRDASGVPKSQ